MVKNFRIIFLSVKYEDFEYLIIYSIKYQNIKIIWRNLFGYWLPAIFKGLGQHCIKNRHVMEITAYAQEHFQKMVPVSKSLTCNPHM